jgi:pyruvate ferredoxin oxidoreductase alpha subunit
VLKQIEGSAAVAATVACCRPQVVAAYPISPQTHIVEGLSALVKSGELTPCEFVTVESEHSAMSVCVGASAAGSRTYTATASQGLLHMAEVLPNVAGLGLPIVMTVANRAIGSPINIWNDHSDVMSQRDCGWIQLHATSNQEAADLHVQAYRLAETLSVPVMVCMDGFVLTHAVERVDVPEAAQVDAYLPPFVPRQVLDPADPITIGAMVGPEAYTEVRYLQHRTQLRALDLIPALADEFAQVFRRRSGGLLRAHRTEDATTIVLAIGSAAGTLEAVVDERREHGEAVGMVTLTCFRPFPEDALREALAGADRVVVLERAFAIGAGGIVGQDVRLALEGLPIAVHDVVAGLGGRAVTTASLHGLLDDAAADRLGRLTFMDLDADVVAAEELAR